MAETRNLVEGETEPIDVTLYTAEDTALVGTGMTVTLSLKDRAGASVDVTGKVDWLSDAAGTVRFSPAAEDLKAARSPYAARWLVTAAGKVAAFPNSKDPDKWIVAPA